MNVHFLSGLGNLTRHRFTCNLLTNPAMFQPKIRSKYQGIEPWQGDFHEGNVFSSENHFAPDMFRKSDISSASLTQSLLLLCLQSWSLQCIIDDTAVLSLCLAFVNAGVRLGCNWHCMEADSCLPLSSSLVHCAILTAGASWPRFDSLPLPTRRHFAASSRVLCHK